MDLTLEFIIGALTGDTPSGAHPIDTIVIDSREAGSGALFVALPGEKADGHDYAGAALQAGAAAAIVDRDLDLPYPAIDLRAGAQPLPDGPVLLRVDDVLLALQQAARRWSRRWLALPDHRIVGITGSVGKTTTKELAADVLSVRYPTHRSVKSYNNEIGTPLAVLHLRDTQQRAVLEMGFYVPGEIALLCDIAPPQVGVLTMIAPVHLERAGSVEAIVRGKSELVEALPPAPQGIAVLNRDDERVMSMAARTQAEVVTYGLTPQADLWADGVEALGLDGIRFWLHGGERFGAERCAIRLPILGKHSVHTALRAAAVGLVEGLSWQEVAQGLQQSRSHVRLLAVDGPNGSTILDDTYNASPPSTIAALNLLDDLRDGRRIAVLGDMLELGAYEEQGHREVGARAAQVADLLLTVGQRGRIIAGEALERGLPPESVRSAGSAEEAADYLLSVVQPGDTILVKGSRAVGMERVVSLLQAAARGEEA